MTREELQHCAEACLASSLECDYAIAAFLKSENADKLKITWHSYTRTKKRAVNKVISTSL